MENELKTQVEQQPSIKLVRNSKGYNFEIKIISLDVDQLEDLRTTLVQKIAKWLSEEAN